MIKPVKKKSKVLRRFSEVYVGPEGRIKRSGNRELMGGREAVVVNTRRPLGVSATYNKKAKYSSALKMKVCTAREMAKFFPNQWLGIDNVIYADNDGKAVAKARVVCTDKTASEIALMQLDGKDIQPYYTTNDVYMDNYMINGVRIPRRRRK